MGFDQGRVVFDHADLMYSVGQTVHAKLEFKQDKVKTFRGIYVLARGFSETHWTTKHSRRSGNRTETYTVHHNGNEVYFEYKIYLVGGKNGECQLNPGKYSFPFQTLIPINCPSSYESRYGHIRYEFKVVVDRAFKFDQEKNLRIVVVAPNDLNMDPYCREPMFFQCTDPYYCCCMPMGVSKVTVKIPQSGFCPGQVIPIELECVNDSKVNIYRIKFEIKESTIYRATDSTKHEGRTIAKLKKGTVPKGTTRNWMLEMEVPDMVLPNVAPCSIIDIDYELKVTVSPEGCHGDTDSSRTIILGHIPLQILDQGNPMQSQVETQQIPNTYPPPYSPVIPSYPGGQSPYPTEKSPHSPQAIVVNPEMSSPYPGGNMAHHSGNPPNPSGTPHYPIANSPYPAGNAPYPNIPNPNLSPYPANAPFVTSAYPGANPPPYPTVTPPYPTVTPYPDMPSHPVPVPVPSPGLGFNVAASENKDPTPYPAPTNPFATASAPEPSTDSKEGL